MTDNLTIATDTQELEKETVEKQNIEPERTVIFEEALEAILFAAGHPISYATLARIFDMTPSAIRDKVSEYSLKYNNSELPRGVILLTYGDSCQLCTKKYYLAEIRDALGIRKSGTLSTSSMEALAIIAYNQPVTRAFVDTLRRVDSSYAMNNLLDRGLIESKGRMDAPGRPMLYGTTQDFLRCFGIKDLSSLPKTTDELMEVFDKAKISDAESLAAEDAESAESVAQNDNYTTEAPQLEIEIEEPSADDDIVTDI